MKAAGLLDLDLPPDSRRADPSAAAATTRSKMKQ
jgi:hypothetical protein